MRAPPVGPDDATAADGALTPGYPVAGISSGTLTAGLRPWQRRVNARSAKPPEVLPFFGFALWEHRYKLAAKSAPGHVDEASRLRHLLRPLDGVRFLVEALLPPAVEGDPVGGHGASPAAADFIRPQPAIAW